MSGVRFTVPPSVPSGYRLRVPRHEGVIIPDPTIHPNVEAQVLTTGEGLLCGVWVVSYTWFNARGETRPSPTWAAFRPPVVGVVSGEGMLCTSPPLPPRALGTKWYIRWWTPPESIDSGLFGVIGPSIVLGRDIDGYWQDPARAGTPYPGTVDQAIWEFSGGAAWSVAPPGWSTSGSPEIVMYDGSLVLGHFWLQTWEAGPCDVWVGVHTPGEANVPYHLRHYVDDVLVFDWPDIGYVVGSVDLQPGAHVFRTTISADTDAHGLPLTYMSGLRLRVHIPRAGFVDQVPSTTCVIAHEGDGVNPPTVNTTAETVYDPVRLTIA